MLIKSFKTAIVLGPGHLENQIADGGDIFREVNTFLPEGWEAVATGISGASGFYIEFDIDHIPTEEQCQWVSDIVETLNYIEPLVQEDPSSGRKTFLTRELEEAFEEYPLGCKDEVDFEEEDLLISADYFTVHYSVVGWEDPHELLYHFRVDDSSGETKCFDTIEELQEFLEDAP